MITSQWSSVLLPGQTEEDEKPINVDVSPLSSSSVIVLHTNRGRRRL